MILVSDVRHVLRPIAGEKITMPESLLITAIALALTCGLLRLRHYLVTCSKEPQPSYRAYVMWFTETDEYADGDEDVEADDILGLWLTER